MPYLIIGAGPAGLGAARAFADAGLPFEIVERHGDVGGIWNMDAPRTPMYETAHFISSKTQSAFEGFPMPAHYPDYPTWRQIREYIGAFADHFGLRERVRFHAEVASVRPAGDAAQGWDVAFAGGEARRYDGVVVATGHNWDPVAPAYPGTFAGEAYHSFHYRSPAEFAGKRVLVVGGGNSGCDIACDAATHAERAMISLRRGYYFLPKHVFGTPTDQFFRDGPLLPTWIAQPALTLLLRLLVGNLARYGLPKPDHKVLETHPIMNTQLIHHLTHGDVAVKPDVAALDGRRVRFADGSVEEVDLIVWATGYRATVPVVDPAVLGAADSSRPLRDFYLNVFSRTHPTLFLLGMFETDGGAYPLISKQADLVTAVLRARQAGSPGAERFDALRRTARPDLSHHVHYVDSPRHKIYVQFDAYLKEVARVRKLVG